ncbi:MAG TPA: SND2/TMEM208 family protein [Bacteroidia bacterium]|jgi:hypothetical protein|nr:SND2/TMEM208 family protein [Bacteroidia bacterium]
MSEKKMNRGEVQKFIRESRDAGMKDQLIYNELRKEYSDKRKIALWITGTITAENKERFKTMNSVLLGLLFISILFKFIFIGSLIMTTGQPWLLLLMLVFPLISIYFAIEISRYHAPMYTACGLITLVGFMRSMNQKGITMNDIIVNAIFCAAIAGLCFYLSRKMFPDYSPKELKTDSKGEYILL